MSGRFFLFTPSVAMTHKLAFSPPLSLRDISPKGAILTVAASISERRGCIFEAFHL